MRRDSGRWPADPVIAAVERSNQRGGRMLSVVDLLEAETLSLRQASWLICRIEEGASWLVGARPGGAGKTALMGALLVMVPDGAHLRLTNPGTGWERSRAGDYLISYEISPASYDAYIWGRNVRLMTRLGMQGCRLVSNLHADTLEEAREQIVGQNGASEEGFSSFQTFIPLSVDGGCFSMSRRVEAIYTCSGNGWVRWSEKENPSERERAVAYFLQECRRKGIRTIQEVRRCWLKWRPNMPGKH